MTGPPPTPTTAIVGAGLMGRWHADACLRSGGRVTAVVDPDEQKAVTLAKRFGGEVYAELSHALSRSEISFVHICSPLGTHESLALAALRGGRHVLVEKPATTDRASAETLVREARAAGVLFVPVHQYLFQPGLRSILSSQDRWGPLRHAIAVACSAGAEGRDARGRAAVAWEILPHFLSLLARLEPQGFEKATWRVRQTLPGEVHVEGELGEVIASLTVSMAGRPTRNTLDLIGENGSAHADLFHGFATFEPPASSRAWKAVRPFDVSLRTLAAATVNLGSRAVRRQPAYPGLRELVSRFYRSAVYGSASPISTAETLQVATAHERIGTLLAGLPPR